MDRSRIWSMSSNSGSANAHRSGDEALVAGSLLNRLQEDVGEASTPRRQGEHGHFEGLKVPGDTSGHDTLTGNAESGRSAFLRRDAVWAGKVSSDKFRGGLENQNITGERVAYRECQRNHSVENGTTAYDGCGEFMAAGKDGTADALKCSVCGCHRNFHHRVIEDKGEIPSSRLEGNADQTLLSSIERVASDINQVLPLIKKTKRKDSVLAEQKLGEILELIVKMILTVTDWLALSQKSMKPDQERISLQVLPPLVGSYDHGLKDEVADPSTIKQISSPEHQTASRERSDDSIPRKKRKRTKFTSEQLTKLESLANSVGWVLGSLTKEQQEAASEEIGIKIDSLKYWFHNTKQKKKHEDGQP